VCIFLKTMKMVKIGFIISKNALLLTSILLNIYYFIHVRVWDLTHTSYILTICNGFLLGQVYLGPLDFLFRLTLIMDCLYPIFFILDSSCSIRVIVDWFGKNVHTPLFVLFYYYLVLCPCIGFPMLCTRRVFVCSGFGFFCQVVVWLWNVQYLLGLVSYHFL
jgi:hypothetical protein